MWRLMAGTFKEETNFVAVLSDFIVRVGFLYGQMILYNEIKFN